MTLAQLSFFMIMTISAIKGCPNKEVPKHPGTHAHTAYAH